MKTQSSKQIQSRRNKSVRFAGRRSSDRRGGAAVEAAICFPFIIILMLGTLEVCAGIYLKESITVCAFEGVRLGTRRRGTAEEVRDRALAALAERQVTIPENDPSVGVTVTPENFDSLNALDPITVQITVPTAGNALFIFDSLVNRNVTASVTMVREFDE